MHLKVQVFCHADNCGCDRCVIGIHRHIPNKRTVDLNLADPKLSQVTEARIARPKVVNSYELIGWHEAQFRGGSGPGMDNYELPLLKNVRLTESRLLQFRGEGSTFSITHKS